MILLYLAMSFIQVPEKSDQKESHHVNHKEENHKSNSTFQMKLEIYCHQPPPPPILPLHLYSLFHTTYLPVHIFRKIGRHNHRTNSV